MLLPCVGMAFDWITRQNSELSCQILRLINRQFEVNVSQNTWDELAKIESWTCWGKHFSRCEIEPKGELTAETEGRLYLKVGPVTIVKVTDFNPPDNWQWDGAFLWMTIDYNHMFEVVNDNRSKMIWTLDGEGLGVSVLGRLFAMIYNRNLNTAIPNLIHQLENR